jgi:hypothetical protein
MKDSDHFRWLYGVVQGTFAPAVCLPFSLLLNADGATPVCVRFNSRRFQPRAFVERLAVMLEAGRVQRFVTEFEWSASNSSHLSTWVLIGAVDRSIVNDLEVTANLLR